MTDIVYSVKDGRIKKSSLLGLIPLGKGRLSLLPSDDYHLLILPPIDGEHVENRWGRLKFNIDLPTDSLFITYILGVNDLIESERLKTSQDLRSMGAKRFVNQNDILLYDVEGQYLYVAIEVFGEGEGEISNIAIDAIGDNFMNTFPEIYRENNSFFHRYMSIFSSIYNDFGEDISKLPKILDIDTAPAEFLVAFGLWLGIDIDCDISDIEIMRGLVREAYELNKLKGTKACLIKIGKIILGEEITILEKNIMEQFQDQTELETFKTLFGDNVYNICILLNKEYDEAKKSQFMYVLKQFIPIRARVQIVNLKKEGELDFHSYLDMNAKLFESRDGALDNNMALDHAVALIE